MTTAAHRGTMLDQLAAIFVRRAEQEGWVRVQVFPAAAAGDSRIVQVVPGTRQAMQGWSVIVQIGGEHAGVRLTGTGTAALEVDQNTMAVLAAAHAAIGQARTLENQRGRVD